MTTTNRQKFYPKMWRNIYSINTEARSIYIDIENENIILCPMNKFFNVDEVKENEIRR